MSSHQNLFFATSADLLRLASIVEGSKRFDYILTGMFESPNPAVFHSAEAIPNLGKATEVNAINCASYLVVRPGQPVAVRPVPQFEGGQLYAIDQELNPDSITLHPGGAYDEEILLYGRIATVSETPLAVDIYRQFQSALKKTFKKIGRYFVGDEALDEMARGKRLTIGALSPQEFDLRA